MGLALAILTFLAFIALFQLQKTSHVSTDLTIETSSGPVVGIINSATPRVAQFLGIPFAEHPIREHRWLPPVPKSRGKAIDATSFGQGCPQYEGTALNIWRVDVPEFLTPEHTTGEECLSVNIWAPWKPPRSDGLLPVIVWIHGGSFQTGSGNIKYQNPSRWIERSQRHIVVGINYRLNIFGFPNAEGIDQDKQNLGFLDQRVGLEWIRSNIANFGGDPTRMILWGQSAGAVSVDNYNLAYLDDPIVSGLIMDSGTSHMPLASVDIASADTGHTNFTFVASHFGCGNVNPRYELDCLRRVSSEDIIDFLKAQSELGSTLSFNPIVDNKTRFADPTARMLAGNLTKKPAIIGTNTQDGDHSLPYNSGSGPDPSLAGQATLRIFLCPAVQTTNDRYAANAITFRYLYSGNFSNIAPQWWEGAYHCSELPLLFGTYGIARGPSTSFEVQVSEQMQDYWVAFAEDPTNGLPQMGWSSYRPEGYGVLIGWQQVVSQPITVGKLGEPCNGITPKKGAPLPPYTLVEA